VIFLSNFINSKIDQNQTQQAATTSQTTAQNPAQVTTTQPTTEQTATPEATTTPTADTTASTTPATTAVSTVSLVDQSSAFYPVTGTVKAKQTASIFPQTSGAVKKVNFQEGDYVKQGDTIVELTGANLTEHPSETQLKIAQTNLANAKTALANVQKTNNESLKTASLQLQGAVDQANAIAYDLAAIQQNQTGLEDNVNILQDSLNNTQEKNNRDLTKGQTDLQNLIYTLNAAQNDRAQTLQKIDDLQNQINSLPPAPAPTQSPTTSTGTTPTGSTGAPSATDPSATLQQQLTKLQAALDAQSKGINDLYDAIDKAKYGISTMSNTSQLSDNQILAQIQTAQNQAKVLDLNLQSTQTKLGYTGDSSDALQLAQQAYNSTKVQLQAALDNAENQVKLAQLNYDLAASTESALIVKAPFSGRISSLDLTVGQQVTPQAPLAEMINPQVYELEVNVDPAIADRLDFTQPSQVVLAGRTLEVPLKSIAPTVNATTHLLKVRLALPPIAFKANQTLNAQLPLKTSQTQTDNSGQ